MLLQPLLNVTPLSFSIDGKRFLTYSRNLTMLMPALGEAVVLLGALIPVVVAQNRTVTNNSLPIVDLGYAIHQASISIVSIYYPIV
jgi:hypothetical protein